MAVSPACHAVLCYYWLQAFSSGPQLAGAAYVLCLALGPYAAITRQHSGRRTTRTLRAASALLAVRAENL